MKKASKLFDLSYLKEISNDNPEFMNDMIQMLCEQIPEYQQLLQDLYNKKDWINLGKLAHKAKSAILMIGMHELADELKKLEENAKQAKNIHEYNEIIVKFVRESEAAMHELIEIRDQL